MDTMESSVSSEADFQTFENFSEEELSDQAPSGNDDDWATPDESKEFKEESRETVKDDLKVLKDSEADAEGKVIKDDDSEEEVSDEESEDSEDVEEESEDDAPQDEEEKEKKKSKNLRLKMNGEMYNIQPDSTFKVKVDGENIDVPVQELINNYSGKVAYDKKFTELGKEKKNFEIEKGTFVKQRQALVDQINGILEPLQNAEKNPMDALISLVEISGGDPYTTYRRIMESNFEELTQMLNMSETERELYFHKKKDDLHSTVARKRQEVRQKEEAFNQTLQQVDQLRQSQNVSEEAYVEASDELEAFYKESGLDEKDITPEAIVDYASLKPHIAVVRELVEPYIENLSNEKYGDVVAELSRNLRDGKVDKKAIQEVLKRNFSVEEDVKELNTKVYQKQGSKPKSKVSKESQSSGFETFDDW